MISDRYFPSEKFYDVPVGTVSGLSIVIQGAQTRRPYMSALDLPGELVRTNNERLSERLNDNSATTQRC